MQSTTMTIYCLFLSILLLNYHQTCSALSIPAKDPLINERNGQIKQTAAQIRNEPRSQTVNGVSYPLNDGPVAQGTNLVAQIIANESKIMDSYRRNALPIISHVTSSLMENATDFQAMYARLSSEIEVPLTSIDFNDQSFGQDRLTIKGFQLKRVINEPKSLKLTDAQITQVCGHKLKNLVQKKALFISDLSHVGQYNDPKTPYKHAPGVITYFCVSKQKTFLPLAIQVSGGLHYSRFDTADEWTLAKMIVNAAEYNDKQIFHYAESHMLLEPIRVEMMRTMSIRHPVYAFLNHHFFQLFANTPAGLALLLSKGTVFDQTFAYGASGALRAVKQKFKELHFTKSYFETMVKDNGLNSIPNYKYADDALALIKATKKFLKEYFKVFYKGSSIANDHELQNWAKACAKTNDINGFPEKFSNVDSLIDAVTHLVYLTSIKHHVVNSKSTWHSVSFPYSLPALWAPLPTSKGQPFELSSFVPKSTNVILSLTVLVAAFNRDVPQSVSLLDSYSTSFLGKESNKAINKYKNDMVKLQQAIAKREKDSRRPFVLLSPENLPHYVWI